MLMNKMFGGLMTVTDRKIEVEPLFFGLLYKVVEYKKLDNGYYESWYPHYKNNPHFLRKGFKITFKF